MAFLHRGQEARCFPYGIFPLSLLGVILIIVLGTEVKWLSFCQLGLQRCCVEQGMMFSNQEDLMLYLLYYQCCGFIFHIALWSVWIGMFFSTMVILNIFFTNMKETFFFNQKWNSTKMIWLKYPKGHIPLYLRLINKWFTSRGMMLDLLTLVQTQGEWVLASENI